MWGILHKLFVEAVCGSCLWKLFVGEAVCGRSCLWKLFVGEAVSWRSCLSEAVYGRTGGSCRSTTPTPPLCLLPPYLLPMSLFPALFLLLCMLSHVYSYHPSQSKLLFLTTAMLSNHIRRTLPAPRTTSHTGIKLDGKALFNSFTSKYLSPKSIDRENSGGALARVFSGKAVAKKDNNSKLFSSPRTGYFTISTDYVDSENSRQRRRELKSNLFALCAACDRGFAASALERREIQTIVNQLKDLSPERNPTRNLYPFTQDPLDRAPLEAAWRLPPPTLSRWPLILLLKYKPFIKLSIVMVHQLM
jgi:hypothetical protein